MVTARVVLLLGLLLIHLLVAFWDIWASVSGRQSDSVSATFLAWSRDYPIFAVFFGVLVGHIFWPQHALPRPP